MKFIFITRPFNYRINVFVDKLN